MEQGVFDRQGQERSNVRFGMDKRSDGGIDEGLFGDGGWGWGCTCAFGSTVQR